MTWLRYGDEIQNLREGAVLRLGKYQGDEMVIWLFQTPEDAYDNKDAVSIYVGSEPMARAVFDEIDARIERDVRRIYVDRIVAHVEQSIPGGA